MTADVKTPGRRLRRLRIAAGVLAAVVAAVAVGVHLPPVRSAVLARLAAAAASFGVHLEASRLEYNLFALTARLEELRVSASAEATPFLAAEALGVDLSWGLLSGGPRIETISVTRPHVTLVRDADGALNLPVSEAPGGGGSVPPLPAAGLHITDLAVDYADTPLGLTVSTRGVALSVVEDGGQIVGRLTMAGPATIERNGLSTSISTLEGRFSFDGTALHVSEFVLAAPEARLELSGTIGDLNGSPILDIAIDGEADVARAARWAGLARPPSGSVRWSTALAGPLDAPTASLTATSSGLNWPPFGALSVTTRATVGLTEAAIESLDVAIGQGRLALKGRVGFDDTSTSEIAGHWQRVDLRALTALTPDIPVQVAATTSGSLELAWSGMDVLNGHGHVATALTPIADAGGLPVDGRLDATVREGRWSLAVDQAVGGAMRVNGTVGGRIRDPWLTSTIGGKAAIEIPDLDAAREVLTGAGLLAAVDPSLAVGGSATMATSLAGTLSMPRAEGTLDFSALTFRGVGPGTATMRIAATTRSVDIASLRIDVAPNVITADGGVVFETGAIAGTLTAEVPDLSTVAAALPEAWRPSGAVHLSATVGGIIDDPQADVVLSSDRLTVAGQSLQSLHAVAQLAGRTATIQTFELRQDDGQLTARGHYDIDTGRYRVAASGTGLRVSPVTTGDADLPPVPIDAVFDLRLNGEGSLDEPQATATVSFDRLDWAAYRVGPAGIDVSLADGRLDATATVASVNGRVEGMVDLTSRTLRATAALVDADLARLTRPTGPVETAEPVPENAGPDIVAPLTATGLVNVEMSAAGPVDAPVVTARLAVANATVTPRDLPPVSDLNVAASFSDGVLSVTELTGRWQDAVLSGTARIPARTLGDALPQAYAASLPPAPGPATVSLRMTSITPAALSPFLDAETISQIAGRIDVIAALEADELNLAAVTGDITLERAELELARIPLAQTVPTHLRLAAGRLDVVTWRWTGPGNQLDVSGHIQLADDTPALDLDLSGMLDLRMLAAFSRDVAITGTARLNMSVRGAATDPEIQGEVAIADTDIVLREPRLAITELEGTATLTPTTLTVTRATGNLNGGALNASGTMTYEGATLRDGAIAITGRGLALELVEGLRTELDADLTLAAADGHQALAGRVTILRGSYRRPIRLTEQLFAGRTAAAPVRSAAPAEPGLLDAIRLNISVDSAEDIVIENNYGHLELVTNLAVIGTAAAPALAGRLTVREGGEVFLGGETYTVRRGTVDFTNPTRIEPDIDLALDVRAQRYDITLELRGTPDTLEVELRSPGLSQQDAISLLVSGELADESTVAQSEVARGQLLMLLSGELLDVAGRAIGLDMIQVGRGLGGAASTFDLLGTESDPSARLTVTKNLRRDVDLIVSQSLRNTGDITWIAVYRPVRRVELRATTDRSLQSYEFRHEVPFGGGPARRASLPRAEDGVPAARVSAIAIRGVTDTTDLQALRRELTLRDGDRFDFYSWQQDRDRIVAFFRERDWLEARLSSRRLDDGAGGVILDYEIDRGPATALDVEGITLSNDRLAEMKDAWSRSVFDGFLVDDLTAIARRAVVEDGYLQPDVSVTIDTETDGEKTIVVQIVPGRQFGDRRVVFAGNTTVETSTLEGIVSALDLGHEMWIDPSGLQTAIEDHYRSNGYVAVVVTPGAPTFDGPSATLPVRIDEGERFRIGDVVVDGAARQTADEIRRLAGIEPGTPFEPAAMEPARRRIEAEYLRLGFNQVQVTASVVASADEARADVTFTIVEGSREILAGIEVAGAGATTRGTIDRALALEPGEPVDFGAIYAAQKRLYDTGVFQTVDIAVTSAGGADDAMAPADRPMNAVVSLEEFPRYRFRYGVRAIHAPEPGEGTRLARPGFVADLLDRNLLGRAVTAGIAGQIEADRWLGRALLSLPSLFSRSVMTNVFLTISEEDFAPPGATPFIDRTREVTIEQRWRPTPRMALTYGYGFARRRLFEDSPDPNPILPPLDLRLKLARLTSTYAWDTRDDPANATRGWFHSSAIDVGLEALGGDNRFVKYLTQQYYYRQIAGGAVLASAFRLGAGRGFGQDLRPREKFYTGGGTSLRGFAENGIGPTEFGAVAGGNGLLLFNQEVRVPVSRWVNVVGFLDAGNIFAQAGDLTFSDLEAGTGFGLRVISPFAMLRVDFGMPLTSRRTEPRGRWYFGIGQMF